MRRTERMARRGAGSRSMRMALLASRAEGNRLERREEKNGDTDVSVDAAVVMISPDTFSDINAFSPAEAASIVGRM